MDDQHATNVSIDGRLSALSAQITSLDKLNEERDRRYEERDRSNKEAVRAALMSAEKASEKTESALKEYKIASNEWRDTVKDLVSRMPARTELEAIVKHVVEKISRLDVDIRPLGAAVNTASARGLGLNQMWSYVVQAITIAGALGLVLTFSK